MNRGTPQGSQRAARMHVGRDGALTRLRHPDYSRTAEELRKDSLARLMAAAISNMNWGVRRTLASIRFRVADERQSGRYVDVPKCFPPEYIQGTLEDYQVHQVLLPHAVRMVQRELGAI